MFKDDLKNDLKTFFNNGEFAEKHNIDGRFIDVIVDNDQLKYRSKVEYEGVAVGDVLYYVSAENYGPPPKAGVIQTFDKVPCRVFDVRSDSGMYEIILSKNVS